MIIISTVVLNSEAHQNLQGSFKKVLLPQLYSRPIKPECLGVRPWHQYFSSLPCDFNVKLSLGTLKGAEG